MTDLEELSDKIEQAGKKWVVAKQISERLDELKSAILASTKNDLEAIIIRQYRRRAKNVRAEIKLKYE